MTLISTGLPTLDALLGGGLRPGGLTLVAGRSQSGMTTMLDTIACQAAFRDLVPTTLADLETPTHHRMLRISSALSGVPLAAMQRGSLTTEQAATVRVTDRAGAPFWFADDVTSVNDLRRSLDTDGLTARLLLVDGMRFLTRGHPGDVAVALAALAAAHNLAVVATHPANWDGGHTATVLRDLTHPMVDVADAVVLLHRATVHADLTVAVARYRTFGWFPAVADFEHARMAEPVPDRVTS